MTNSLLISSSSSSSSSSNHASRVEELEVQLWQSFNGFASKLRSDVLYPLSMNRVAHSLIKANEKIISDGGGQNINSFKWIVVNKKPYLQTGVVLGKGASANVYLGVDQNGIACALKILRASNAPAFTHFEITFLKSAGKCKDSYVIHMLDGEPSCLALELGEYHLKAYIERFSCKMGQPTEIEQRTIAGFNRCILASLAFIKENFVVHCDVKDENFIVTSSGSDGISQPCVKLADFEYCSRLGELWRGQGTPEFFSPEQFSYLNNKDVKFRVVTDKLDVWGGMLVLVQINMPLLSKSFAGRAHGFSKHVVELIRKFDCTPNAIDHFAHGMDGYFKSEASHGRHGIFDGLSSSSTTEEVIQQMAMFVPKSRIEAKKALKIYDGLEIKQDGVSVGLEQVNAKAELEQLPIAASDGKDKAEELLESILKSSSESGKAKELNPPLIDEDDDYPIG